MEAGQRLRALRVRNNLTQEDVGKVLGVKRATISALEKGKSSLTFENIIKLANYFKVSADELVFGRPTGVSSEQMLKEKLLPIVVDKHDNPVIKLLPHSAQAGYLQERADPQYWEELPEISMPDRKYRNGQYIGVEVWGESMLNTFTGGDWIICEHVTDAGHINYGDVYVIVTENRAPVVKRVEQAESDEEWLLVSDNSSHKPYTVRKEDVIEIWRYDTLIRTQPFTLRKLEAPSA